MRFFRAIGFGVLLVVASIGALALGERLREARTPPNGNALQGQTTASPSPAAIPPLRSLSFPSGYAVGSARIAPDGRSAIVPTSDWKSFAMFDIPANDAPPVLRGKATPAGGEWLPDGSGYLMGTYLMGPPLPRNADGAVSTMKQQQFSVFERDGSLTAIGSGWISSRPSPDSRWIPVIDDCCPSTIRLLPRHGGASQLLVRLSNAQSFFIVGWDPRGRLLYSESSRLFAVDLARAVQEIVAPVLPASVERTYSYVGRSPDGTTVVLQVSGPSTSLSFALSRTGTVPIPYVFSDTWIGPHEIIAITKTKFLSIDTSTGAERDLATKARPSDGFVGTSSPYLLWRENITGPLHLYDTQTGADRVLDVAWSAGTPQRLDGGRFFLPSDTSPAILDAAAFFRASAPTATPTPTAPLQPLAAEVYGDVRDGRVLKANPNLVIPNDLPPVAGALVRLPALRLEATSDAAGRFTILLGQLLSDCATDVIVTAPGFGPWVYHQTPLVTYEHSGGGVRLFIQLETDPQERTYTHHLETPRPPCTAL